MHSRANKTHFHKKGFALSLVLKGKLFGNRRWSLAKMQALYAFLVCLILQDRGLAILPQTANRGFEVSGFTLAVCPFLGLKFIHSLTFISAKNRLAKLCFNEKEFGN